MTVEVEAGVIELIIPPRPESSRASPRGAKMRENKSRA